MSLKKQTEFNDNFKAWFDSEIKPTIDDSRRRYRMEHKDAEERAKLGLSAVPSTKSSSAVDRAVDKAIMEYHSERDAISYTARYSGDKEQDFLAALHTEIFHEHAEKDFPFPVWNTTSLTAGWVDGLEAALVSWRYESYEEERTAYIGVNPEMGVVQEVSKEQYEQGALLSPDLFLEEKITEDIPSVDTWWIDQLLPGENFLWDMKAPLLNVNMGQVALVKLEKSIDDIIAMSEKGIIDDIKREELAKYQDTDTVDNDASDTTDPDMGDYNMVELWLFFEKESGKWHVTFSVEDKLALSKKKSVNEVFFNGRKVNKLPVVMGTTRIKPFLASGRGIPEAIAPVEDEYESIRNMLLDSARQDIEGRWRVNPDSDVDINELINSPVVRANLGELEKFDNRANSMSALQQSGALLGDINELAPVGMESSQVVPSGTDKTLGAVQLALGSSNEKLSVSLLVRNFTFFKPLLYLIAEMTIAFETNEEIIRVAESRLSKQRQHQGMQAPRKGGMIDLGALDIPLEIQVNAGLGSVPRQQKLQYMQYVGQIGAQMGIPLDHMEMFRQGCVLLGFSEDQFISSEPPPPKGPEMKADIKIDFDRLPPEMQTQLLQMFAQGSSNIDMSFKGDGKFPKPDQLPPVGTRQPMQGTADPAVINVNY